ncbi:MAG: hypothetical protein LBP88_03850 [Treponema sp.]|nr:hypothetical protein [Treponema sp.]
MGSLFLFFRLLLAGYAQEDLILSPEEIFMERAADKKGFHLFIKKKPGLSSVLLMESAHPPTGEESSHTYRALEGNGINRDEFRIISSSPLKDASWFLTDSSPENHPVMGDVLHIYIPPIITYGYPETRQIILPVEDGMVVNIRTFALPYCDYSGRYQDNLFTLSIPPFDPDAPGFPLIQLGAKHPEPTVPLKPEDVPAIPVHDTLPDLSAKADEEDARFREEVLKRLDGLERTSASPQPPQPLQAEEPMEERLVFAPSIYVRGGAAVFFPGPQGRSLGLQNTLDPIGTIALTNKFTKIWGVHLGFDRDPLLMNRIVARVTWDIRFIGLEAGPFFGLLNSHTGRISPGLSLVLHARIPQWGLFSSFQHDTTLGKDALMGTGDYMQSSSEIKAGFTLPFGSFTLSLMDRNSTIQDDLGQDMVNQWIRYNLALEIAKPPHPLGLRIDLGYQTLHWNYRLSYPLLAYGYDQVYAGLELSYRIGLLTLLLGLEAPLYPWVYPQIRSIKNPQAPFFGQITLGFRLTFPPASGFTAPVWPGQ